jgi:hypothetical protein
MTKSEWNVRGREGGESTSGQAEQVECLYLNSKQAPYKLCFANRDTLLRKTQYRHFRDNVTHLCTKN